MKLSFSTLGCPDWRFAEMLSTGADLGYTGIEIRGVADEIYAPKIPQLRTEELDRTAAALSRLGLEIPVLTSGAYLTDNPNMAAAEFEVKDYVMLAAAMNVHGMKTPYVRLLGEKGPDTEHPSEEEKAKTLATYMELCRFAAPFGVTLLVETNGYMAETKVLKEFMEAVEAAGITNAGVIWDVHHTYRYYNESPAESYGNIKKYIKHTHFKDSVVGRNGKLSYMLCGYGDLPIEEAVALLRDGGYEGYYSYEWVKRWSKELAEPGIAFYSYANYMRMLLD